MKMGVVIPEIRQAQGLIQLLLPEAYFSILVLEIDNVTGHTGHYTCEFCSRNGLNIGPYVGLARNKLGLIQQVPIAVGCAPIWLRRQCRSAILACCLPT
jgi:hypothetical protein